MKRGQFNKATTSFLCCQDPKLWTVSPYAVKVTNPKGISPKTSVTPKAPNQSPTNPQR